MLSGGGLDTAMRVMRQVCTEFLVDLLSNNLRRMRENVKKANFALSLI